MINGKNRLYVGVDGPKWTEAEVISLLQRERLEILLLQVIKDLGSISHLLECQLREGLSQKAIGLAEEITKMYALLKVEGQE